MTNAAGVGQASDGQGVGLGVCQYAMDACESSVIQKPTVIVCAMKLLKKQIQADIQFVKN
jgi:hypothetical protein